jgi:hypothetical protein
MGGLAARARLSCGCRHRSRNASFRQHTGFPRRGSTGPDADAMVSGGPEHPEPAGPQAAPRRCQDGHAKHPPHDATSTAHGSTALLRVAARPKRRPSHRPGSRVSPEGESRLPNTRARGALSQGTGVLHTAGAAGFSDPSPSRPGRPVAAAGLHKTFRGVARDGPGILRRSVES